MSARKRRCVSVSERTYLRLRAFCESQGVAMQQVLDEILLDLPEASKHEDLLGPSVAGVSNVPR